MPKKIKDLAVKVGSYQKDGKEKNKYKNVGYVLQLDNGGEIWCLDRTFSPAGVFNPENRDTVIINAFDVKDSGQQAEDKPAPETVKSTSFIPPAKSNMDDEIPF